MKKLYVLRHAKADINADFNEDHEKPLAARGHHDAKLVAQTMKEKGLVPEIILSSDSLRTTQTVENMLPILGDVSVQYSHHLYLATAGEILKTIASTDNTRQSLMLVGHNPGVHQCCAYLTGGGAPEHIETLRFKYPTAALACFDIPSDNWQSLNPGCATLVDFITPKMLKSS